MNNPLGVSPRDTGNHTRQRKNILTSVGIEPKTVGLDLPSLCRLSYKVAPRKSGTILDGEMLEIFYFVTVFISYDCAVYENYQAGFRAKKRYSQPNRA